MKPGLWGKKVISESADGSDPYMIRWWIGQTHLHEFHRGDHATDLHDHPWPFVTFPLQSYVEEYVAGWADGEPIIKKRVVKRFRFHRRPADFIHRVVGKAGPLAEILELEWLPENVLSEFNLVIPGKFYTIVWTGKRSRQWQFLKKRDGKYCFVHWWDYLYGDGASSPCDD